MKRMTAIAIVPQNLEYHAPCLHKSKSLPYLSLPSPYHWQLSAGAAACAAHAC